MTEYYECGDGWLLLIKEAKDIIEKYNQKLKEEHSIEDPLEFFDIKEKWGALDISLNYYVPEILDKITEIEKKSVNICEHCGTDKNVKREWTHGWIMTLCDKCRQEELDKFNKKFNYDKNNR